MDSHRNTELIVSIDFGSTFTKVQYAISRSQVVEGEQLAIRPCIFQRHRGAGNTTDVPSIIQYGRSGEIVGWGPDPIVEGAVEIKGIKLCIPHEDDRMVDPTTYPVIAHAIQRRNYLGKTVLTVVTDFMTRLWQVCKPQIVGDELDVNWRLIITHPVGWNIDKLEQAIDTAIVMPDQGNSTYTICFQTEAEAALITELNARGIQLVHESNNPTGHETSLQDGEIIVVADFGGLTVVSPASHICGVSLFSDAFVNLLENKAKMLLHKLPTSHWFHQALKQWEHSIFPAFTRGLRLDATFDVAREDFKDSEFEPITISRPLSFQANLVHFAFCTRLLTNLLRVELESIMEFYMDQTTMAIQEQINKLRQLGYTADVSLPSGSFGPLPTVFIFIRKNN
ncbi:hypothetical protein ONZ43_g241 [Nemania bipapillata]|uniref:Uncharacterized protein n=1 Tax=Nemania bipapillata TaxID=110536 RepID=A0ACC2J9Q7_9PEZI|nr:hypothetical protein ONZ43_g241 [Nemania bipapillata]